MRRPLEVPAPSPEELEALDALYRTTRVARLRTRAQMVLLAVEQRLAAPAIAAIVREDEETVRRWLKRYRAAGIGGGTGSPHAGRPEQGHPGIHGATGGGGAAATTQSRPALLAVDAAAPRRLHGRADRAAALLRDGPPRAGRGRHRPQPPAAHHQQPRPGVRRQRKRSRRPATASRPAPPSTTRTSST